MHLLVYTQPNGQVCVVTPTREWLALSDENTMEKLARLVIPAGLDYRMITKDKLPKDANGEYDRTFRDAWTDQYDTDTVDVDVYIAKEIHLNTLREARNKQLAALDIPMMKALESGNTKAITEIAAKKQALRDMTIEARIDMDDIHDLEELKEYIPGVLL